MSGATGVSMLTAYKYLGGVATRDSNVVGIYLVSN